MTIPRLREMVAGFDALAGATNFAGTIEEARISEEVTALIYRQPVCAGPSADPVLSPGGFVAGDAKGIDGCMRRLADSSGASIASV